MREIVHIQIGQCGNMISNYFWQTIADEHDIDPTGKYNNHNNEKLEYVKTYFNEHKDHHYTSRAVLIDSSSELCNVIKSYPYGQLFDIDNFIFGKFGAGNDWASGYYSRGAELIEQTMDVIRKEVEDCDYLQGFQLVHSLGGGTGSGMGTLTLEKLRDEYNDRIIQTFSIFPSAKTSVVIKPYNTVFSIHKLTEFADSVIVFDNEALHNIYFKVAKCTNPTYGDLNWIVSYAMSNITASFRFSDLLNNSLRKLANNLVPYPRLHFLISSVSPLRSRSALIYEPLTPRLLVNDLFDSKNALSAPDPWRGRYYAAATLFRGSVPIIEVEKLLYQAVQKRSSCFISEWIPNNTWIKPSSRWQKV